MRGVLAAMAGTDTVSVRYEGDVAWVTIDNPPVNATSTSVRAGLARAIKQVQTARVAILICAGRTFVAGGDMSEFDRAPELPLLPDVVQALEDSETPFVAAMHGTVLGGGFELAMACAWRIADEDTNFGLPEVNVGLIPGAGGSQRLPRLIGLDAAIDLACGGKMIGAADLHGLAGLDQVVTGDLIGAAQRFASNLPARPLAVSCRDLPELDTVSLADRRQRVIRRAKGQQSPGQNFDALLWAALPFAEGQKRERALHLALRKSAQSRALRHAFFAERTVSRPAEISGVLARQVSRIAIVGGGLMGAGIAAACLAAGLRVTLLENDETAARTATKRVAGIIDGSLKRGRIDVAAHDAQLAAFSATHDFCAAQPCDLAIEAVFEDLSVKRAVFAKLADVMGRDAILATNTSYLDPQQIFAGIPNPARCLGLHFFSPAHIMRLLEIVNMPQTDAEVLATGFALARRLRKVAVLSGICDGFIGNRMLAAYRRQADYFLADGALPYQVDAAMRDFGMPMGPYELQDLTGLQIAWANRKRQAASRGAAERSVPIADQLCQMGRLGQRSGQGWYRYDPGARTPVRDADVEALIQQIWAKNGVEPRAFSPDEIANRMIAVLVNEGACIVEQGIAGTADAVDMVQIHGYGFPRWRGGPMHHAQAVGIDTVAGAMQTAAEQSPGSWTISRLLSQPPGTT
jgi:3-hydroxyacyl-CoA dehydrogenase